MCSKPKDAYPRNLRSEKLKFWPDRWNTVLVNDPPEKRRTKISQTAVEMTTKFVLDKILLADLYDLGGGCLTSSYTF